MVRIRLMRLGKKKSPFYRIVVTDARSPRDGRFIEQIGHYDPRKDGDKKVVLDRERARYWLNNGAKPSETVVSLFKLAGFDPRGNG